MDMDTGELVTIQHHASSPRHPHTTIAHHHQQFQPTNIIINQGQSKMFFMLQIYLRQFKYYLFTYVYFNELKCI